MKEKPKENQNKKKTTVLIIFVLSLVTLAIGMAVAAINVVSFSGTNTIQTGTIVMSYTEPSSAMELLNALPMSDSEGKAQSKYFEFNVTSHATTNVTDNDGVTIPYEINISSVAVSSPYVQLQPSQVKIHLVEIVSSSEVERKAPTLISSLTSSTLNPSRTFVYETEDIHKNGSSPKSRVYRMRAWIDESFDVFTIGDDTYQYKFKVNVNAQVNALGVPYGPELTQDSCFDWTETSTTATITDYKCFSGNSYGLPTIADVIIPEQLNGKDVVEIGDATEYSGDNRDSFFEKDITSVILPNTIITIGKDAFAFNQLASVTIPSSVVTIKSNAFVANQLTSISLGNGVETLGNHAFAYNQLTSVTIPNSVVTIGCAFFENQLTSVTLGNSVQTIGDCAFSKNQLTSVTIPNSVTSIGGSAFNNNQLTSVIIPNSVETIGSSAFSENYLTNVTLGTGVQTIGSYAFSKESGTSGSNNSNLTSIINPSGNSFDWSQITGSTTYGQIFITGTITHPQGNITVSAS